MIVSGQMELLHNELFMSSVTEPVLSKLLSGVLDSLDGGDPGKSLRLSFITNTRIDIPEDRKYLPVDMVFRILWESLSEQGPPQSGMSPVLRLSSQIERSEISGLLDPDPGNIRFLQELFEQGRCELKNIIEGSVNAALED